MCKKKEYKCYKGQMMEECCNSRVEEAVAHRTYILILIIAVILLIISLTVRTADNKIFVDQVSFASTITSIILSVIAIWMSISGERTTNEIRTKVGDSVDRLIETTGESKVLAKELRSTLAIQKANYEENSKKMEQMLTEIEQMKNAVDCLGDSLGEFKIVPEQSQRRLTEENLRDMTVNILSSFNDRRGKEGKQLMLKGMAYLYDSTENGKQVKSSELVDYLRKEDASNLAEIIAGLIMAISLNGVFTKVDRKEFDI